MSEMMMLPLYRVRWTRRCITVTPCWWKNQCPRTTTSPSSKTRPRNAVLRARRPRSLRPRPAWLAGASASRHHDWISSSTRPSLSETSTRHSTGRAAPANKLACTCNVFLHHFFLGGTFQIHYKASFFHFDVASVFLFVVTTVCEEYLVILHKRLICSLFSLIAGRTYLKSLVQMHNAQFVYTFI